MSKSVRIVDDLGDDTQDINEYIRNNRELSNREIADHLGVTVDTVRGRRRRLKDATPIGAQGTIGSKDILKRMINSQIELLTAIRELLDEEQ